MSPNLTPTEEALVLRLITKVAHDAIAATLQAGAEPESIITHVSAQIDSIDREDWRDGTPPGFKGKPISTRDMVEWFGADYLAGAE